MPAWALADATRPDARSRIDARLGGVLHRLRDARFVARVKELYGYVTDPRVPAKYKLAVVAGLLYLVNPFDAIPDVIPGAGYLDDAAVVLAILEAVRRIVGSVEESAKRVVSHAIAETEEVFVRRGVQQVTLTLWAATLAAAIGLVYTAARDLIHPGAGWDPFVVAMLATGAFGLWTSAAFARRVWRAWAAASPALREPLAYAVLSTVGPRQLVVLALPILALVLVIGIKLGLAARSALVP